MPAKAVPKKNASTKPNGLHALTESRVEEIAATVRDGSFRHGVTLAGFEAKWKLCTQRIHELSSLAMKKVRAEVTDPEHVAATGFAAIKRIADEAMLDADKDGNNAGHRALALRAYDTWLTKSGVAAPSKAAVHVTGDYSQLTDEQLEARKLEVIARLVGK